MAPENTGGKDRQEVFTSEIALSEPAESGSSPEVHSVRVDSAADPRVAPPKAWKSEKPPGGKLPINAEPPQDSKSA